jgi:uncharacterized protein YqeY
MALREQLTDDLKAAMKAGDTRRRSVVRLLLSAVKYAELEKNGPLTPDEAATALKAAGLSLNREQTNVALEASWAKRQGEPVPAGVDEHAVDVLARAGEAKAAQAGPLSDAEVQEIVQKQAKQRRDSAAAYRNGQREDLAANEEAELAVLLTYLPQPLTPAELRDLVRAAIAEVGATGPRDMGKVMPVVMARAGQRAEGRTVSTIVRELLS